MFKLLINWHETLKNMNLTHETKVDYGIFEGVTLESKYNDAYSLNRTLTTEGQMTINCTLFKAPFGR